MLVKPVDCLQESLLLGKLCLLVGGITAHSEAVLNARVKIDLVRKAALLEDLLRLVALLGGEDGIRLGGRDRQGAGDALELVLVDKRRVGEVADLDAVLVVACNVLLRRGSARKRIPWNSLAAYLGTEAVAKSTELLDAVLLLQSLDSVDDDGVDGLLGMRVVARGALGHPGHKVKVAGSVERDWVAIEGVDDQGEVAVGGELVGHQLAVLPDANDVGDVEQADALVLLVGGRSGKVAVVLPGDLDVLAGRGTPVLFAVSASPKLQPRGLPWVSG